MHHANHWYGHAHILARYCGLIEVPRIWGYLQHGWNVHDGFAVGTAFVPGFPKFVGSEAPRRRGWAAGIRNYVIVGSPWAYLLELERQREWERANHPREGTIVYPFHGWEQQSIVGSHAGYIEEIKATEEFTFKVCLYWHYYRDVGVRPTYEVAGLRLISHGYRGHLWRGTDTDFLDKQLAELRRHKRVVSNRMGSALLYGASVGADVGVYGDPMILEAERAALGGMERQRRLWPEMHQAFVPPEIARELARVELGLDQTLSRTELTETLGWRHARRGTLPATSGQTEGSLATDEAETAPVGIDGRLEHLPTDDEAELLERHGVED